MLGIILFFLSSYIFGSLIAENFKIKVQGTIKLTVNFFIGISANTLLLYFASNLIGLSFLKAFGILSLTAIGSLIFFMSKRSFFDLHNINFKASKIVLITLLAIFLFISILFYKSIYFQNGGLIAGNRIVWTDWPIHISLASSFSKGANFTPTQNPNYAGLQITYPFMSDFISGILQLLGANIAQSFIYPGIIFSGLIILCLYSFGRLFLSSKKAVLGVFIGIFWGGLGFVYFIQDLISSNDILNTLLYPPKEYTFYADKNLWFFNFIYSELIPQRGFLLGLPAFFVSQILLILGLSKVKNNYLILSAIIIGFLPLFHMHTFISVALFDSLFIPLFLLTRIKEIGIKKVGNLLINLSIFFISPTVIILLFFIKNYSALSGSQVFGVEFGWMKHAENFFLFWFKNTGLFLPLGLIAIYMLRKNLLALSIGLASTLLFVAPNLFRFAPWSYDNLKILTYWYFIFAFFAAYLLSKLWANKLAKPIVILLIISLTLSGVIETSRLLNKPKNQIPLWSQQDFQMAEAIVSKTPPHSVILAAPIHMHPVSALAGRLMVIGYPGNAWSWGFSDWSQREQDVKQLFLSQAADPEALIDKYKIQYALISSYERSLFPNLNEQYIKNNADEVEIGNGYKLYKFK